MRKEGTVFTFTYASVFCRESTVINGANAIKRTAYNVRRDVRRDYQQRDIYRERLSDRGGD